MLKKEIRGHCNSLQMTVKISHESLHTQKSIFRLIAKGCGNFFLLLKIELIIFSATYIVEAIADPDKHVPGAFKGSFLSLPEDTGLDKVLEIGQAKDNNSSPEHGLDVTHPPLALFNIWLEQVAVTTKPLTALLPKSLHGTDKLVPRALYKTNAISADQFIKKNFGAS